jgi:1-acyl-sn-glycerol-3-phosphate acyltransferase
MHDRGPLRLLLMQPAEGSSQFALLKERRFAPFFWTQFLGAFNDNLFKFAFTVMVTFHATAGSGVNPALVVNLIAGLFILPFLLFSATCGQIADKYDKRSIAIFVKTLEVAIMALAAYGFIARNVPVLLGCTFLMGLHSTIFGPVKYAFLPQALTERELTGGNAMVEMGTFVAILVGNLVGGLLVGMPSSGPTIAALGCIAVALAGRATVHFMQSAPPLVPDLEVRWNPLRETMLNLRLAAENIVVFRGLMGVSWLWFFGASFLTQLPAFAKDVLGGSEQVASLLLVVFSVGIGVGSLLCESLSRRHVELGLVPIGAFGMTLFATDLYFASRSFAHGPEALGAWGFLQTRGALRVLTDLGLLSGFAGLFSVPLYALIQSRSQPTHRARIFAASNILGALFMIASAALSVTLIKGGASIPTLFLVVGIMNAVVALYIFLLVPEFLLRFISWVMANMMYRFRIVGDEHIPERGPALLTCNHVSFVDALLLMAASPRPIRFIMDHRIFKTPVLGAIFRLAKTIPVAAQKEDAAIYANAFAEADRTLSEGDLLCIFPEGSITRDGELQPFKAGLMKILATRPVPVVPMALQNLWGSFFSRVEGLAMTKPFRRGVFSSVRLKVGEPLSPDVVTPERLHEKVLELRSRLR